MWGSWLEKTGTLPLHFSTMQLVDVASRYAVQPMADEPLSLTSLTWQYMIMKHRPF